MNTTGLTEIITALQLAISPVILISGVGMLLLVTSNRIARVVDRARNMIALAAKPGSDTALIRREVAIHYQRASLLRLAIGLAAGSALASAVLVIAIFMTALTSIQIGALLPVLFIFSMACLIGSLIALIRDIHLSLHALKLELDAAKLL